MANSKLESGYPLRALVDTSEISSFPGNVFGRALVSAATLWRVGRTKVPEGFWTCTCPRVCPAGGAKVVVVVAAAVDVVEVVDVAAAVALRAVCTYVMHPGVAAHSLTIAALLDADFCCGSEGHLTR
jgi:hypothetical protein